MPKVTAYTLTWSTTKHEYELYESRLRDLLPIAPGSTAWFNWLVHISSFTFQGKSGFYTARKEHRPRGDQYWYAYFSLGEKRTKKYLGKTDDLTPTRLEQVASSLSAERDSGTQPKQFTPARSTKSQIPNPSLVADTGSDLNLPPHVQTQKPDVPVDPLLATKLHMPRLRSQLVPRSHLTEQLQTGLEGALTLVSAPAGFGKTTLLCQWLAESYKRVAWLSLEPEDDEPTRFLSYAIAALQTLNRQIGTASLALLYAPQPVPVETVVARLINDLTSSEEGDFVLVLDD
jgi:LuxR family maltose regulon positive regulatory protein